MPKRRYVISDGERLRAERLRLGLSQEELGRALDVSRNTISRWELGRMQIEAPAMLWLALRGLTPKQ